MSHSGQRSKMQPKPSAQAATISGPLQRGGRTEPVPGFVLPRNKHAVLELEYFLPYRLSVLSNHISQTIANIYAKRFGISITEWRAIAVLGRYPGLSANGVAERTAMDKVAVSRALARLLTRGLLQRESHGKDRRRSVLELTAAGYRIYDEVVPLALRYERDLLVALDESERTTLNQLLAKLERKRVHDDCSMNADIQSGK